jgi:uncharacterized protein DUF4422
MIRILTVYHFEPRPEDVVENLMYRPLVLPVRGPLAARDPVMSENSYAEMRAHHWAQLNWESGITHYGFQHYRRLFALEPKGRPRFPLNLVSRDTFAQILARLRALPANQQEVLSAWVAQFDIATAMPFAGSLGDQFIKWHGIGPWRALIDALDTIEWEGPRDARIFYPANMFIIRAELFERYMTFWRAVMALLSRTIEPEHGTRQERIFGFISERLWTLWLEHEKRIRAPALKEVPVIGCAEWKI